MHRNARALLIVRSQIVPEREEEFNRWYNEAHIRDMMNVPGILSARRYVSLLEEGPKYAAVYEVESPAVFESEPYLNAPGGRRDGGLPKKFGKDLVGYTRQAFRLIYALEPKE